GPDRKGRTGLLGVGTAFLPPKKTPPAAACSDQQQGDRPGNATFHAHSARRSTNSFLASNPITAPLATSGRGPTLRSKITPTVSAIRIQVKTSGAACGAI